ncbi:hypothetical protein [Pendulispora albinea]|uniref:AsmA-like C-terminal domain-containing protein n=1 Tax=Pendulispora albinea TaxID=2741071 RepID=A0ABZ2MBC6_9BACT
MLLGLGVLFAGAVIVALAVLYNLDHPWIKGRVRALAHSMAGIDVDYHAVHLRLREGITIDDVVVQSPAEVRAVAPELARIGRVEAGWSSALVTGSGRRIARVTATDVALTVVLDENGRTSFDGLGPQGPATSPPEPKVPLSHRASTLDSLAPKLPAIDVTGLAATLVRTDKGQVIERMALKGVALHAGAESEGGAWHLRATLGAASAPLDLDVAREQGSAPAGDAHGRFWLAADLTSSELTATVDLEVPKQSFVQGLGATHVLHAEARARLDPGLGRTTIAIPSARGAGGIVTVEGALELPDAGPPFVRHAAGDVDFVRLLAMLPHDLVPVRPRLGRGQLHYRVDNLALDALPRLNADAKVAIDADFADVKLDRPEADVDVGLAKLSAHVEPAADASLTVKASLSIDEGTIATRTDNVAMKGVALDVMATQAGDGALTGNATLDVAALTSGDRAPRGGTRIAARGGKLGVRVERLAIDRAAPLASRGAITVTTELASLDLGTPSLRAKLDRLTLRSQTSLSGRAPYALNADVNAAGLELTDAGGHPLAQTPIHVGVAIDGAQPDLERPRASRGTAHVALEAGAVHAKLDATKGVDDLQLALESNAPTLGPVRPFLPPDVAKKVPLERMAATLRSRGRVERIFGAAPSLEQHAEIAIEHPAYEKVSARSVALVLDAKGSMLHPALDGDVRFEKLTVDGANASDDRVTFAAALDREALALQLRLATEGRAQAKLSTALAFDRDRRAVTYAIEGSAARLAPLATFASVVPALRGLDLSKLEVGVAGHGALVGAVADVDRNGVLRLQPALRRTAWLDGSLDLHAKQLHWSDGNTALRAPEVTLAAKLGTKGERRTVSGHLAMGALHVASGTRDFDVAGLRDEITASLEGDLAEPRIELTQRTAVEALKQDVVSMYPIGHATAALVARRDRHGVIQVSSLEIANGAGGTKLSVAGAFDPNESQRRLALRGTLHQDLARLSNAPGLLQGRGTSDVAFQLESPNLSTFRVSADARVAGATVRLPRSGVVVEGADGEVPISVALRVGKNGVRMIREDRDNPFSALRFADQHPLLSRGSFISIRSLVLPQVSISPLVGNLQIEQNIISLRQFEMGIRGGRVTGLCALDWNGEESTLDMHVRADGVKSSRGEPFSGNAALAISAGEHSIEGRADILQIGKRHFIDLLDLQDPFHADPAFNRVRSALGFGYPDRLRVTFNHGFASVHVTFGGLARLVSVGDIRGIPIGPLIDRFVGPVFPSSKREP